MVMFTFEFFVSRSFLLVFVPLLLGPLNTRGKEDVPSESLRHVGKVSPRERAFLVWSEHFEEFNWLQICHLGCHSQSTIQTQHSFGS
ncbi:hypothetical protein B0T13DRAFT_454594 [Neurospora crassa]|nr:hypothetical protein B0T13DRAFT_454594 [Neurospora crassa]